MSVVERLSGQAVALTRELRAQGVRVGPAQAAVFLQALGHVQVTRRREVYAAARATLTSRAEEDAALQVAFARVFGGPVPPDASARPRPIRRPPPAQVGIAQTLRARVEGEGRELSDRTGSASELRTGTRRHFEHMTDEELRAAERAVARLAWRPPDRRSRRQRAARAGRVDGRATVRAARGTLGEPVRLVRRAPRLTPRPLLLLIDVSGSMERYTRVLMVLAHALVRRAVAGGGRVEVFAFGTHPVRVTRALNAPTPDAALLAVQAASVGWAGGTRIGASLHRLATEHRAFLPHGAVTLVFSDGLDTGEPEELARELRRLRRRSRRLTWCSPLIGTRGYAPVQRAVRAALPLVDDFVGVGSVQHLAELVDLLNDLPQRGRMMPGTSGRKEG